MGEFASKGVAGTALGLSIGSLGAQALTGGLGNLFGGWGGNCGCGNGFNRGGFGYGPGYGAVVSSDDQLVNRYEAGKDARISELETEIKLRDANFYTLGQMNDMRNYVDRRFDKIEHQLCDQAVWNTAQTGTLNCMAQQIAALNGLTKLVIPKNSICPEVMPRYNTWAAPAATETATAAG